MPNKSNVTAVVVPAQNCCLQKKRRKIVIQNSGIVCPIELKDYKDFPAYLTPCFQNDIFTIQYARP